MTIAPSAPVPVPPKRGSDPPQVPGGELREHIGLVVLGSLAAGLLAAMLLVAAPAVPAEGYRITGAVLCGFGLGWAAMAISSARLTDQPQRWAAAPALFMGGGGLLLVALGPAVGAVLDWVWPPALLLLVVFMAISVRRRLRSRGGRLLLYPVLTVLAFASVGGAYQVLGEATDAEAYTMPGQLVDVGGHSLHLTCSGSGSPTVVLEPGAGGISSDLRLIIPKVAGDTRVCVYDRAGRGWSEPAAAPQDAKRTAGELHTLLRRARVPGPYVLAGHSFGGLYTLTFAAQYPDDVAGMVLVDSTAPATEAGQSTSAPRSDSLTSRVSALVSVTGHLGLGRLVGIPTPEHLRSTIDEYAATSASAQQAGALRDFGDKPLVVLTASSGSDAEWFTAQDALATLSTRSDHRIVEGVDHAGMITDEGGATATGRAILDVVSSVRAGPAPD